MVIPVRKLLLLSKPSHRAASMVLGKGPVKAGHGGIAGHLCNLVRRTGSFPKQFAGSAHLQLPNELTIALTGIVLHDPSDLAGTVMELFCHFVAGSIGEMVLNVAENS